MTFFVSVAHAKLWCSRIFNKVHECIYFLLHTCREKNIPERSKIRENIPLHLHCCIDTPACYRHHWSLSFHSWLLVMSTWRFVWLTVTFLVRCQTYKGRLSDGSLIAMRSMKMRKRHSTQTYMHHIELISKLRHCHLVSSLGHCFECCQDDSSVSRIFIIFELAPNESLRDYISGRVSTHRASKRIIYIEKTLDQAREERHTHQFLHGPKSKHNSVLYS